jgi:Zn-dependent protease with chaperone function
MNFFEQQERARRNTGWLLFVFTVAVIALGFGVYGATMVALRVSRVQLPGIALRYEFDTSREHNYRTTHRQSPGAPRSSSVPRRARPLGWWRPEIFVGCFGATLGVIGLASMGRTAGLRAGGIAVAEMMGARVVPPGTQEAQEQRLRNVVEEMAIAASVPVPQIFVLDDDAGINAFAAGHTPADAAIVVTRGMLDHLNRDELQGVIGHEFSHILNGDMRMNVRLMGLLFGILVIAIIGRGMLRIMSFGRGGRGRGGRGGGGIAALVVAGALVTLIGYAGLFCARLIKAAVSRQREYLADSASVQFTRNPDGIAGALKKIGGFVFGSQVKARRAEEASHFFFSDAVSYSLFSGWFATHPPLRERIRRIDPSFDGHYPHVRLLVAEGAEAGAMAAAGEAAGFAPARPGATRIVVDPAAVTGLVGNPGPDHTDHAAALLRELPDTVRVAVGSAFSASALVYALLLSEDAAVRERQMADVRSGAGPELERETWRLAAALTGIEARWRLPIAKLALPSLHAMTGAQQATFARTVEALVAADAHLNLFEFAIVRTLLRHLAAGRAAPPRAAIRAQPVLADCRTVLSCLARNGQPDETGAQRAFGAGAARLRLPASLGLLPGGETCALDATGEALDRLRGTVPRVRKQILDACAHCVLADGTVTLEETELLRVVADALDCPLPPFITPAA